VCAERDLGGIRFGDASVDAGDGAILVQAMREEIARVYDGLDLDAEFMPRAGPAELSPPDGAFLVGWIGGRPVCCGGLKRLSSSACEIKKMYVVPDERGKGVARELLRALERKGRELSYAVVRLETGPRQPAARRLFESEGYEEVEDFNGNPVAAFWGEKPIRGRS
jgi:GNAT superfamily N-acetyltransferase